MQLLPCSRERQEAAIMKTQQPNQKMTNLLMLRLQEPKTNNKKTKKQHKLFRKVFPTSMANLIQLYKKLREKFCKSK
jgi:hypothetical protein